MADSKVRGARLVWQQLGEGPDLILVHGLAASRAFWFPTALKLQDRFRVTMFDLRGHGYSEMTESGYSCMALGQDLLGLMDALKIDDAIVVGHSFGGGAALEAAVLAPQRIQALALLDSRVQRLQPQMGLEQVGDLSPLGQSLVDGAGGSDALAGEDQIGIRFIEAVARLAVAGALPPGLAEVVPFGQGSGAKRAAKAWLRLLEQTRATHELTLPGARPSALRQLEQPILLAYGEDSPCWPSARALASLAPRAELRAVPAAGHFFPLSHPLHTTRMLEEFFDHELDYAA